MKFYLAILPTILAVTHQPPRSRRINSIHTSFGGVGKQTLDISYFDILDEDAAQHNVDIQLTSEGPALTFIPEEGAKIKTGEYYGRTADGKAEMTLYENSHGEVWGSIVDEATGVIYNLHVDSAGVETITIQTQESFQEVDEEMTLFAPLESARRLDDEQGEDEDNVLDVMVAYTPAAECKAVDEEPGCERTDATRRAIRTEIELGMLEANEAISKSMQGGGVEFRLVHIMEINYQEVDFVTTLQEATLGGIEGLLERREEFHADLVSVWIAGNGCGLAWIGPHKDYAFSTVNVECATGYYSFPHELAHSLGCRHDVGTEGACGEDSQVFGFRDSEAEFRTIMAYSCQDNQCDNGSADGICTRIIRFSNTETDYLGKPLGNQHSNCAGHIQSVKSSVAHYYEGFSDDELKEMNEKYGTQRV